ncbi:hypothetical protein [Halorussus aquaticus]|uniref:Glycine zipper domain-containing protein n=1 Tax=Halorussus aquaticus TaxID=2953748 RepID=A0ABD5Q432_9EURY|nr:hypothetical protein [Halorussus aquaticus]
MSRPRPVEILVPMTALGGVGFLFGADLAGEPAAVGGAALGAIVGTALGSVVAVPKTTGRDAE